MRFALLADCPEAIPKIASWYFDQWGYLHPNAGLKDMESKLQGGLYTNLGWVPVAEVKNGDVDVLVMEKTLDEKRPDRTSTISER